MADEIVTTVSGKSLPRTQTKFIKGEYYEIGKECVKIEDRWYRVNSGLISYNMDTRSYFLNKAIDKQNVRTRVIIGTTPDGKPLYGYTRFRRELFVPVFSSDQPITAINPEIAKKVARFSKDLGVYWLNDSNPGGRGAYNPINPQSLPYSLKDYKLDEVSVEKYLRTDGIDYNQFHAVLAKAYHDANSKTIGTNLSKAYNAAMEGITFGIESESANLSLIDLYAVSSAGFVPLRDGSVSGLELVTLPNKGFEGVASTVNQFSMIEKLFQVNAACSVHIHVGGKALSDQQLLALYCLCVRVQDEVFELVHPYKRNLEYLKKLAHEYSEPLKSLGIVYNKGIYDESGNLNKAQFEEAFKVFCRFLTMNNAEKLTDVFKSEPKYKIMPRYYWANFVNFLRTKDTTVEFRCFPPTFDPPTIAFWTILCKCIYRYAIRNYKSILSNGFHCKIGDIFDDLLADVDRNQAKELSVFVNLLKEIFTNVVYQNSFHAIARDFSFDHYQKSMSKFSEIYARILSMVKLPERTWNSPKIIEEFNTIKV